MTLFFLTKFLSCNPILISRTVLKTQLKLEDESSDASSSLAKSNPPQFFLQIYDPNERIVNAKPLDHAFDVSLQYLQTDEDGKPSDMRRRTYHVEIPSEKLGKPIQLLEYYMLCPAPPLVVKTKVQVAGRKFCRVALHISAASGFGGNCFTDMTIAVCVPADLDGDSAKMSRKGGTWDEIKRLLIWHIDKVQAGKNLAIQAQFKCRAKCTSIQLDGKELSRVNPEDEDEGNDDTTAKQIPQFHTIVRCSCSDQIASDVEINVCQEEGEDEEFKLTQSFSKSFRLLYRAVETRPELKSVL